MDFYQISLKKIKIKQQVIRNFRKIVPEILNLGIASINIKNVIEIFY